MIDRVHCEKCGRFIPYERAREVADPPMIGWNEWWEGICEKCEHAIDEG